MNSGLEIAEYGIEDARADMPRYAVDAHKYTHGSLVVAGGSREFSGAPILAATAGLYGGAGIVKVCLPEAAEIYCHVPQALIVRKIACDLCDGAFSEESISAFEGLLAKVSALVVGPGIGVHSSLHSFLKRVMEVPVPKVLDADALNFIALHPEILRGSQQHSGIVLTPHDGEFSRLSSAFEVDTSLAREARAAKLATSQGCVVVLKGPGTLVATPDGRITRNSTGNNRLATAGTGDVLAGLIGALLAQGLPPGKAARLGVFLHGLAADKLDAFIADDLAPCIAKLMHNGLY